jgi:hypothetical protein
VAAGEVQELLVVPEQIPLQLAAGLVVLVYIIPYLVQMLPMLVEVEVPVMVARASHQVQVALVAEVPVVQMLGEQQALQTPVVVAVPVDMFLQAAGVRVVRV